MWKFPVDSVCKQNPTLPSFGLPTVLTPLGPLLIWNEIDLDPELLQVLRAFPLLLSGFWKYKNRLSTEVVLGCFRSHSDYSNIPLRYRILLCLLLGWLELVGISCLIIPWGEISNLCQKYPKNLWYDRQIRDERDSVAVEVFTMQISTSKLFFCAPPCKWRSGQECQGLGYDTSGQTDILL